MTTVNKLDNTRKTPISNNNTVNQTKLERQIEMTTVNKLENTRETPISNGNSSVNA